MKILVTGASGFIGTHLIARLRDDAHETWAIVRPTTDTLALKKENIGVYVFNDAMDDLISFMKKNKFDGIIHLATLYIAEHQSEDISKLIDTNLSFSTKILEAGAKSNIPWFINTGTGWQHYNNKTYSPVNLYAATKQAFEDIATYYRQVFPINFVTITLFDTFGPQDTRPKIFNIWSDISKSGNSIDMSPGNQIIDISYVDNVIDGYLRLMTLLTKDTKRKLDGKSFVIKSPERMSLKKLANIFEKVMHTKLSINWGKREYRQREVMRPWTKGKSIPGWKAKVSLEEGIKKTFNK